MGNTATLTQIAVETRGLFPVEVSEAVFAEYSHWPQLNTFMCNMGHVSEHKRSHDRSCERA